MSNLPSPVPVSSPLPLTKPNQDITTAAKGGGVLLAGKILLYAGRFLTGLLLARLLAAEQYGLYDLSLTVAELVAGVASLGLASALVRYVSVFANHRDENGLWGVIQIGLGASTIVSVLFGASLYFLAESIAVNLFHEPKLIPLLQLVSLVVPFFSLSEMIAASTRGFKNMHYTVISQNIAQPIIKLVLILGLAIGGMTAVRAVTASGLTQIIVACLLLYFLNKQFSLKRPLHMARYETREIIKFSLPVYISDLLSTFGGSIKTLLLGTFHSVGNVGIFAVASQINLLSDMFHQSIVTISQPIIAELHGRGERAQVGHFYQTMTRWTFTLNLPMFLIITLFPGPILGIFGQSFTGGVLVLSILAWGGLVNTGTGIPGVILDMSGNTMYKFINTVCTLIISLGLSIGLIPIWGMVGAAVATLATVIIVNLLRVIEVYLLFRLLPYNTNFLKPVIAGVVTLLTSFAVMRFLRPEASLIYLGIDVIILLTVYVGMILLLGLSQEDRLIVDRLCQRVGIKLARS
jgi:O-antigen/teichoic acid export membrane protein